MRGTRKFENRVLEISEITQGLKSIAKELNVPVLALSQLSRAVEQKKIRDRNYLTLESQELLNKTLM